MHTHDRAIKVLSDDTAPQVGITRAALPDRVRFGSISARTQRDQINRDDRYVALSQMPPWLGLARSFPAA